MAGYVLYSLDWQRFQGLVERPAPEPLAVLGRLLSEELEGRQDVFDEGDPIRDWPTDADQLAQLAAKRLALPDWYGDLSTAGKNLWEGVVFQACMNCPEIDVGFRVDNDGVYWDVIELVWKHLRVAPGQIGEKAFSTFGTRPYRYHPPAKLAKTREQHAREEADRRSSLKAMGDMLGQFLDGVKQGRKDPTKVLEELDQRNDIAPQHKSALKGLLSDEEMEDDQDGGSDDWTPMHSMHAPDEVQEMLAEVRSIDSQMRKTRDKEVRRQYGEDLLPAIESVASDGRMLFVQVDT